MSIAGKSFTGARAGRRKRVIVGFPQGQAFLERTLQGILDYARQQGGWSVTRMPEVQEHSLHWLRHWQGDGAFVLLTSSSDLRIARRLTVPVVNLAALVTGHHHLPTVMVDHLAMGRLAAEHLLARQFRHFGYYGSQGRPFSDLRKQGFLDAITRAGGDCQVLETPAGNQSAAQWMDQQERLEVWVRQLPQPIGIMTCNDPRAGMVLDACLVAGLRVPEEVAIIGADNDPVTCNGAAVPLSTVARRDRETGFQAARCLDRLMAGAPPPAAPILVPPEGVIQRRSTESYALADAVIQTAVHHVYDHLSETFGVERLLQVAGLSRRRFELRFRQAMGRTPYDFIIEQRVRRARQMLAEDPRHPLAEVAAACGFTEPRHLRAALKRAQNETPK